MGHNQSKWCFCKGFEVRIEKTPPNSMWLDSEKVWTNRLWQDRHGEKKEGWSSSLYMAKVKKAEALENYPRANKQEFQVKKWLMWAQPASFIQKNRVVSWLNDLNITARHKQVLKDSLVYLILSGSKSQTNSHEKYCTLVCMMEWLASKPYRDVAGSPALWFLKAKVLVEDTIYSDKCYST